MFFTWSPNWAPFDPGRKYDPFGVYARVRHGGDISAAERAEQVRIEASKITARIKELQAEDKNLSGQHEGLVYNLGLLDNFARAKNRMMVDTINGHFKLAQFVLFEEQINGGMVDCCEITLGGRPWGSMSNSERINTGLDIIETLSTAMGIDPLPIIIDNAESVSHPRRTSGQQIQLVVSDVDKTLRVHRWADPGIVEKLRVMPGSPAGPNCRLRTRIKRRWHSNE
jgi:hypothetical protein